MTINDIRNRWQQSPIPFLEIAEIDALFAEIDRLNRTLAEKGGEYGETRIEGRSKSGGGMG